MNVLIIDWFNLIKRYINSRDLADLEVGEVTQQLTYSILNRLDNLFFIAKPDLIFICSDNGFNKRAAGIVEGYKSNRKKFKTLSEEEREKSYIEYLKMLAKSLPVTYIDVEEVEADMIIRCVVNFIKQIDNETNFTIATNDSDMLQLIDNNVRIFHWTKGFINKDNWAEHTFKTDQYFNAKNYALAKSIVGDASDNIKGVPGIGWKKCLTLFEILHLYSSNDCVPDSIYTLIEFLHQINDCNEKLDSKQKRLLSKLLPALIKDKKNIHNNMLVIDLNMIETPYLFNIIEEIKKSIESFSKSKFRRRLIMDLLKLNYEGELDTDDEEILRKNSKALVSLMYIYKKTLNNSNKLLEKMTKNSEKKDVITK